MTRLAASIVAIAFFLQQGNCCCGETVCNVWVSVMTSPESCGRGHERGDEHCHHHDEGDTPAHSHEHHFCVGTHLFYLDTAADAAPDELDLISWHVPIDEVIGLHSASKAPLSLAYLTEHFNSAPARAELQVFQI
ncbi:hypothetical protein K2Y11_08025 [bacterium]|nr:hypothetical protein [bacterium]